MFCPEDGTEIPMIDSHSSRVPDSYHGYYDPCSECGCSYWYDGDNGEYHTGGPEIPPDQLECSECGRVYSLEDDAIQVDLAGMGDCPSDDCPSNNEHPEKGTLIPLVPNQ